MPGQRLSLSFFFFNDTATTEIYTLSLHDALPISRKGDGSSKPAVSRSPSSSRPTRASSRLGSGRKTRSEEHTSELQSQSNLVCRLLLEKKKRRVITIRVDAADTRTAHHGRQMGVV